MFLCFNLITFQINGQENIYLSSDQFLTDGVEFHDKGEYDNAIASYQKVSKCDPNYERTCYELALTYYYIDKYDEALAKCKEALSLGYDETVVYSLMGSILDETGRETEGIVLLTAALKKWPYNQNLLYNLAVCYINTDQPLQAEEVLIKSILINPYHARTHLYLAKANYMMGRITQSYLAYNMVLLLNPTVNNIAVFEEAVSQKSKLKMQEYKYPYSNDVNSKKWDEIKDLLQSELAINKDFDYDYEYDYTIARQSLMLFRKLNFDPSDTSIYNSLYVRLFADIFQNTGFETYLNYIFKNINNENVAKWSAKNEDKLNSFVDGAKSYLNQGRLYGFSYQDEQNLKQTYHFNDDGLLISIGEESKKNGDVKNGAWKVISESGYISEEGVYVNDKTEGEWLIYWPDGAVKNRFNFVNDEMTGTNRVYYPNGALKITCDYKTDKMDGLFESYSHSGFLTGKNFYSHDLAHGPGVFNNYNEGYIRTYVYNNDTLENENTETWLNGNKKKVSSYHKGMVNGAYTTWYSNSVKESDRNYKNDTLVGKYYEYYPNSQKSRELEYNANGNLTGKIITYDRLGNITSEEGEYNDGKLTGTRTEFFPGGGKERILTYQNDHLTEAVCFDVKGNQLYKANDSENSIYVKSFYADGIISSEGLLKNDKRQGKWRFYNALGIITSEMNYSNGLTEGAQYFYYENKQIEKEYTSSGNYTLGEYKEYYINGHLKSHGNYDSTGVAGKWLYYYENDTISNIIFYKKGNLAGRSYTFYPGGQLKSEESYNNDGKSIRYKEYATDGGILTDLDFEYGSHSFEIKYPNGKLKEKKNLSDNVLHGPYESYYPNGQLAVRIEYNHGLVNGLLKKWDYHGNLTYEMPYNLNSAEGEAKWYVVNKPYYIAYYEQDKLQGKTTTYYYTGQKAREAMYVDGERNGISDYFSPEGSFMYRIRYVANIIKAYSCLDKSGNMIPEIAITDTTSKIITYYPNGKVSAIIPLYRGLYHGRFISYYPSGTLLREATYISDNNEGYDKSYYPNNKLREILNYKSDNLNGLYELYYENGKMQKSGNYFMNSEDGEWIIYSPEGNRKETFTYRNGVLYDIK